MRVNLIAAIAENGVIGLDDGRLPWHFPEDLKFFKQVTTGGAVIMGRKTHESIGKALKDRCNIVLTRTRDFEDVACVRSLREGLLVAKEHGYEEVYIIGGAEVYKEALDENLVDQMIITHVHGNYEGDVYFPEWNKSKWTETIRMEDENYDVATYRRKRKGLRMRHWWYIIRVAQIMTVGVLWHLTVVNAGWLWAILGTLVIVSLNYVLFVRAQKGNT